MSKLGLKDVREKLINLSHSLLYRDRSFLCVLAVYPCSLSGHWGSWSSTTAFREASCVSYAT